MQRYAYASGDEEKSHFGLAMLVVPHAKHTPLSHLSGYQKRQRETNSQV